MENSQAGDAGDTHAQDSSSVGKYLAIGVAPLILTILHT